MKIVDKQRIEIAIFIVYKKCHLFENLRLETYNSLNWNKIRPTNTNKQQNKSVFQI